MQVSPLHRSPIEPVRAVDAKLPSVGYIERAACTGHIRRLSRLESLVACTILGLLGQFGLATPGLAGPGADVTPNTVVESAPASDWTKIDPASLLVLDLDGGRRVVIALADAFAPVHIANIRRLAQAHWYDGLVVERVQDDYVVQWGDPDGKKPLPTGVVQPAPTEYDRPSLGMSFERLPYRDTYADRAGASSVFPVAEGGGAAWLVHCYGMVGVGRDLNPDTGTGAELYAVIGHAPRALDRNIAIVGRVLSGMDWLSALPRGTGDLGVYTDPAQRLKIRQVRLANDMPLEDQPRFERLKEASPSFHAWVRTRANRQDRFFVRPAGAVDVCNALPPVRAVPR